jgi:hypothetical protein
LVLQNEKLSTEITRIKLENFTGMTMSDASWQKASQEGVNVNSLSTKDVSANSIIELNSSTYLESVGRYAISGYLPMFNDTRSLLDSMFYDECKYLCLEHAICYDACRDKNVPRIDTE